jgi:hypothetical protein
MLFLIATAALLGLTALFRFARAPARAPVQALTLTPTHFPVSFSMFLFHFPLTP